MPENLQPGHYWVIIKSAFASGEDSEPEIAMYSADGVWYFIADEEGLRDTGSNVSVISDEILLRDSKKD